MTVVTRNAVKRTGNQLYAAMVLGFGRKQRKGMKIKHVQMPPSAAQALSLVSEELARGHLRPGRCGGQGGLGGVGAGPQRQQPYCRLADSWETWPHPTCHHSPPRSLPNEALTWSIEPIRIVSFHGVLSKLFAIAQRVMGTLPCCGFQQLRSRLF